MDANDNTGDRPFGPDAATILTTEHWSLLGTRSMIWNEAMSRTTVFLTVVAAGVVAFLVVWGALFLLRRLNLRVLRRGGTRFPTPPDER